MAIRQTGMGKAVHQVDDTGRHQGEGRPDRFPRPGSKEITELRHDYSRGHVWLLGRTMGVVGRICPYDGRFLLPAESDGNGGCLDSILSNWGVARGEFLGAAR